ncbi:MAG: hypothetical protein IPO67_28500 [Deltaproteobacteria bacterium]|nr:hypothetical protein [Deltaproteobacteria bacterium]
MWKDIAWQGIGQRWEGPRDSVRIEQARGAIRFLEPALPTNLAAAPAGLPLMAHSSELALATTGRMNPEMVARLSEQVRDRLRLGGRALLPESRALAPANPGYNRAAARR